MTPSLEQALDDPFAASRQGQLHRDERALLYTLVLGTRPSRCLEVGTWLGRGSTFFIASALAEVGAGHLWTVETDGAAVDAARAAYAAEKPDLAPFVTFLCGRADEQEWAGEYDLMFLDGGLCGEEALAEWRLLEGRCSPTATVAFHDWGPEQPKTCAIHRYMATARWRPLVTFSSRADGGGLAVFQR